MTKAAQQQLPSPPLLNGKEGMGRVHPPPQMAEGSGGKAIVRSSKPFLFAALVLLVLAVYVGRESRPVLCKPFLELGSARAAGGAAALGGNDAPADTYTTALPHRALARGLLQTGELARLRRFTNKLLTGEPVTVVTLGGSVTWGAIQGNGYVSQFFHWLNTTFPPLPGRPPHALLNRGVGGATSSLFSTCTNHFVPADADLVVVEFAHNDGAQVFCGGKMSDPFDSAPRREYEVLLRRLLRLSSRPAVVLLNYYNWFMSKRPPEGCKVERDGKECLVTSPERGQYHLNGENDMAVLGSYYGLQVLSMRAAVYPLLLKGGKGYNISTWASPEFKPGQQGPLPNIDDLVYIDHMHPADDTGMRYLADLLITLVRHAAADLSARPLGGEDAEIAAEPLLPPMVLDNTGDHFSQCYLQKEMEPLGSSPDGLFQFVNEQTNRSSEKWGWVARQPGAAVTFTLDTRTRRQEGEEAQWGEVGGPGGLPGALAAGADGAGGEEGGEVDGDGEEEEALGWGQVSQGGGSAGSGAAGGAEAAAGPRERVKVLVGYLKSYEHMGTAEVACTSGCSCEPATIDGHWERPFSLPDLVSLEVTSHPQCQLRVTVGSATSSGEHKVKVLSLMVLQGKVSTRSFTGGQLNALGNKERFSEMQWAFKKATNKPAAAQAAAGVAQPAAQQAAAADGQQPAAAADGQQAAAAEQQAAQAAAEQQAAQAAAEQQAEGEQEGGR